MCWNTWSRAGSRPRRSEKGGKIMVVTAKTKSAVNVNGPRCCRTCKHWYKGEFSEQPEHHGTTFTGDPEVPRAIAAGIGCTTEPPPNEEGFARYRLSANRSRTGIGALKPRRWQMIQENLLPPSGLSSLALSSNPSAMIDTDPAPICDSCRRKYRKGMEVYRIGRYCLSCARSVIATYFEAHPGANYVYVRGISSLHATKTIRRSG
jgi:hypothetical protein